VVGAVLSVLTRCLRLSMPVIGMARVSISAKDIVERAFLCIIIRTPHGGNFAQSKPEASFLWPIKCSVCLFNCVSAAVTTYAFDQKNYEHLC